MAVRAFLLKPIGLGLKISLLDIILLLGIFAVLYTFVSIGMDMTRPMTHATSEISTSIKDLPYYMLRSLVRMFIAFAASLLFTFIFSSIAASSKRAEKVMIPLLDILQSIPVLGFLSVTITAFISLFPGSILGYELAAIFAIFTSQAWNIAYSFYQSLILIPRDLKDAARIFRLNRWERFTRLELPFSMIGLVWNSIMSFGGGWFFLAASEAITVLNKEIRLQGIGSYIAVAFETGDNAAVLAAIITMFITVILLDLLFFRPLMAWAQKFRVESFTSGDEYESQVLTFLKRSPMLEKMGEKIFSPTFYFINSKVIGRLFPEWSEEPHPIRRSVAKFLKIAAAAVLILFLSQKLFSGLQFLATTVTLSEVLKVISLGFLTLIRVLAVVVLTSLVWVPIGVGIGLNPRLSRIAQPIIQIAVAFPSNMFFPIFVVVFHKLGIDLSFGGILLLALGAQWYILFNVIAGAMNISSDLREAEKILSLRGVIRWKKVIIPAILPFWVTGGITAAGGAWNASIVAEAVSYGEIEMRAPGLGSYMTEATINGDWGGIILSIVVMCLFVVSFNRLVWHRLYIYAEERCKTE